MKFTDRLQHAWNAFMNRDPTMFHDIGSSYYYRPDRTRLTRGNEKTIVNSIINRISMDCAAIDINHCRLDDNGRYLETISSGLNECLTLSANTDQTGRSFIQDIVMSMMDEGVVAIIPVETDDDPTSATHFGICRLRTAKIVAWYPEHIRVYIWNEWAGKYEERTFPKNMCAIIENPFYSVMNEPNSTMQRLIRKLNLSDMMDEQQGSQKLDIIVQLPYVIKTQARRQQAEQRRKDIESQLAGSRYGIAYADSAEKITQLNRSVENNTLSTIEYLTNLLYSQLGITVEIMNGTASDAVMNNYYSRTIEPIMSAICDELKRKFLTKTARSQKQSIEFFRDPFKLVPVSQISEIADKFTRNEIMTSNEIRQIVGMKPAEDPNADELRNKNLSASKDEEHVDLNGNLIKEGQSSSIDLEELLKEEDKNQNE